MCEERARSSFPRPSFEGGEADGRQEGRGLGVGWKRVGETVANRLPVGLAPFWICRLTPRHQRLDNLNHDRFQGAFLGIRT